MSSNSEGRWDKMQNKGYFKVLKGSLMGSIKLKDTFSSYIWDNKAQASNSQKRNWDACEWRNTAHSLACRTGSIFSHFSGKASMKLLECFLKLLKDWSMRHAIILFPCNMCLAIHVRFILMIIVHMSENPYTYVKYIYSHWGDQPLGSWL